MKNKIKGNKKKSWPHQTNEAGLESGLARLVEKAETLMKQESKEANC